MDSKLVLDSVLGWFLVAIVLMVWIAKLEIDSPVCSREVLLNSLNGKLVMFYKFPSTHQFVQRPDFLGPFCLLVSAILQPVSKK